MAPRALPASPPGASRLRRHCRAVLPARVPPPALRRVRPRAGARFGARAIRSRSPHGLWHSPGWTAGAPRAPDADPVRDLPARDARRRLARASRAAQAAAYWVLRAPPPRGRGVASRGSAPRRSTLARRVPGVPVAMLPNGVDAPADGDLARGRFRLRLGLAGDAPLVVFLGRLHPIKRLDLLAAAFAEVRARHRTARLASPGPTRRATAAASSRCSLRCATPCTGWERSARPTSGPSWPTPTPW